MAKTRIAVLISGRGSNLQSLIDAAADDDYPAKIALVLSNRPAAKGLDRATAARIPTKIIDHKAYGDKAQNYEDGRTDFEAAISDALDDADIDYVCLAGFMRMLTGEFVNQRRGRILNIHPSLLPAFKGLNVHERMINSGVKIAGCTVHFVTPEMDAGPIVGQAAVPVAPGDTPQLLAERILEQEHKLYPRCVALLASGKARLSAGGLVLFDDDERSADALANPGR
ncbi:MAG: phosphoribosylglycinamide formyltransferase [Pseudomonadota bacterium]